MIAFATLLTLGWSSLPIMKRNVIIIIIFIIVIIIASVIVIIIIVIINLVTLVMGWERNLVGKSFD